MYPGAVKATRGEETGFASGEQYSVSVYYTKDSYQDVRSYYVSEIGEPRMEEDDGDRGKSSFFSYQRRMPEDIGVRISGRQGRSRVPSRIFNSLNGLAVQGVIPESRVNEIREKYSYLERCYFVSEKDESGKLVAADELIYKRYEEKIGAGGVESESSEEVMERAQQLMAQGRMQEATELLKKMQEGQLAGAELATSPRAAEMWVECLEELAASAYDVSITIYL
ncbi:MAG: hypothetical protein EA408_03125 [Marinilabiliales bacterium]|nr:MAG: hypothetical protein EA408_03125 [Marinilabiliales bacterium]